jgi:outer membrane protein TolC
MLIGMNELLADARERISAMLGFIDASREYWLAEAELQLAVGGKLPQLQNQSATEGKEITEEHYR